jgi:hypothetical protein
LPLVRREAAAAAASPPPPRTGESAGVQQDSTRDGGTTDLNVRLMPWNSTEIMLAGGRNDRGCRNRYFCGPQPTNNHS